jgi:RHS repeat-associated protein
VTDTIDAQGNPQGALDYSPYGETIGEGALPDFRYAGMFNLPETGLYLTHYRLYDPSSKRWLNRDPIGETGGFNLYGYVGGNPVSWVDPLGLSQADVQNIYNTFRRAVDQMTKNGERMSFSHFNNTFAENRDDESGWPNGASGILNSLFRDGKSTLICGQQWERVFEELQKLKLDAVWSFDESYSVGHAFGVGTSNDPNDPKLIIDPWKDTFTIDYKK